MPSLVHMTSPARCEDCGQIFPSKSKAVVHAKSASHTAGRILYICLECPRSFQHVKEQHQHRITTGHMLPATTPVRSIQDGPSLQAIVSQTQSVVTEADASPYPSSSISVSSNPAPLPQITNTTSCHTCLARFPNDLELMNVSAPALHMRIDDTRSLTP